MTYKTLLAKLRKQSVDALRELKKTEKTIKIEDPSTVTNKQLIESHKKSFEVWQKSHQQFLMVLDLLERKKIKLDDKVTNKSPALSSFPNSHAERAVC